MEKEISQSGILVLDYGSQYTLLITRRLREVGIYSEIVDGHLESPPDHFEIQGIILSGGPDSVSDTGARKIPSWVFDKSVPILGICYGLQLLVEHFGGTVESGSGREYGAGMVSFSEFSETPSRKLFTDLPQTQSVWMSHGDHLATCPDAFHIVGKSKDGVAAAISHGSLPYFGFQFHPEVVHSEHGHALLKNFVEKVCGVELDWKPQKMVDQAKDMIKATVEDGKVLMAVSGGVDSTVAAALMVRALGAEKVTAVFVDHGMLRKDENTKAPKALRDAGIENLVVLDESDRFLGKLQGVDDPEEKRKIIGRTFIEAFEEFANQHSGEFTHLGQGTLYPDVIESAGHGSGSKVIKSHHNVGGLPEKLALKLVEPFRFNFKDEVRQIGMELGLPKKMVYRHPFPGPGLAVRILGALDLEKIKVLQEADHIYMSALRDSGHYDKIWQAFAVLLPVKTVGVMGDNRTYQWVCALRAVTGKDAMTAGVSHLPMEFLSKVAAKIVQNVDGINRVVYDVTTKPPATIEWE